MLPLGVAKRQGIFALFAALQMKCRAATADGTGNAAMHPATTANMPKRSASVGRRARERVHPLPSNDIRTG